MKPLRVDDHCHALIMAGGRGERFWPWSRENRPKQLLPLFQDKSMIELTVQRLLPLVPHERIWIVTNALYAKEMRRLMPWFPRQNYIVEPVGKDSAGAVMLGCATIAKADPQAIMALLPADHLILQEEPYLRTLQDCFLLASTEKVLVTIGIKPTKASSAYGYIQRGARFRARSPSSTPFFRANRFLEKPNLSKARRLVATKKYYWNAGMFVWLASTIKEAFDQFSPLHAQGWASLSQNSTKYLHEGFLKLPKISIDYAVMEKADNILVAEGHFDWDDVGSWDALYHHLPQDEHGNTLKGAVALIDSHHCLCLGSKKLIAGIHLNDLIIVDTPDALLVCPRSSAQRIKDLVQKFDKKLR